MIGVLYFRVKEMSSRSIKNNCKICDKIIIFLRKFKFNDNNN